jgi:hypothetical protein
MYAAFKGSRPDICRLLLEYGANPNQKISLYNETSMLYTFIENCCDSDDYTDDCDIFEYFFEIIKLFVKCGAHINCQHPVITLNHTSDCLQTYYYPEKYNCNCAIMAISYTHLDISDDNRIELAKYLFDNNARITHMDQNTFYEYVCEKLTWWSRNIKLPPGTIPTLKDDANIVTRVEYLEANSILAKELELACRNKYGLILDEDNYYNLDESLLDPANPDSVDFINAIKHRLNPQLSIYGRMYNITSTYNNRILATKNAIMTFLCIHTYHKFGYLIGRDPISIITKLIWDSRRSDVWDNVEIVQNHLAQTQLPADSSKRCSDSSECCSDDEYVYVNEQDYDIDHNFELQQSSIGIWESNRFKYHCVSASKFIRNTQISHAHGNKISDYRIVKKRPHKKLKK